MKEIKVDPKYTYRKINYIKFNTTENWKDLLPKKDWSLVVIADDLQKSYLDLILRKGIENNVGYIHSIGEQHDLIHNMADEEIVFRYVDIEDHYLPKHMIPTTGNDDFEEGLWYGVNQTFNDDTENKEIVIVDFTENSFDKINSLIKRFESGYLAKTKNGSIYSKHKRKLAVILSIGIGLLGLFNIKSIQNFIEQDGCLDSGSVWEYSFDRCYAEGNEVDQFASTSEAYVQDGYNLMLVQVEKISDCKKCSRYNYIFDHYGDPDVSYNLSVLVKDGELSFDE